MSDPVVENLIEQYRERSRLGVLKYGTTLDNNKLTLKEWLVHMTQELMDASLYANKMIMVLDKFELDDEESLKKEIDGIAEKS